MRYGIGIDDLPKKCDGGRSKIPIGHALSCKKRGRGLVFRRRDELKDEVASLTVLATSSDCVRDEQKIIIGRGTI